MDDKDIAIIWNQINIMSIQINTLKTEFARVVSAKSKGEKMAKIDSDKFLIKPPSMK